jgi:DNA polymerase III delta subunit
MCKWERVGVPYKKYKNFCMLYVFHGTDETHVANKRIALLSVLQKKRADAEVFQFDAQTLLPDVLDDLLSAQGLFFQKHIIVINNVCEKEVCRSMVLERIEAMGTSEHVVILSERTLDAEAVRKITPHARDISEHKKQAKKPTENPFAMAEALAQKDTRKLWLACVTQLRGGAESEMLVGTLHWQVRMLLFAKKGISAGDAGVSPYALQKAERCAGNFSLEELQEISRSLVELYHNAHRGMFPMKTGLERWCLRVR